MGVNTGFVIVLQVEVRSFAVQPTLRPLQRCLLSCGLLRVRIRMCLWLVAFQGGGE
jgi:hypothetical protein